MLLEFDKTDNDAIFSIIAEGVVPLKHIADGIQEVAAAFEKDEELYKIYGWSIAIEILADRIEKCLEKINKER